MALSYGLSVFLFFFSVRVMVRKTHLKHRRLPLKIVSQDECFYVLPSAPQGRIFNGSYEEALHINTKGVTVGKGQWRCDEGSWKSVYKHTCLTCLPGRSVQQCQESFGTISWSQIASGEPSEWGTIRIKI